MSEVYSIELKLDGTRLCVSLMHNGGWGSLEISGDSVDLAPLINAARAEGMREAARIAENEGVRPETNVYAEFLTHNRRIRDAILSAIGERQ